MMLSMIAAVFSLGIGLLILDESPHLAALSFFMSGLNFRRCIDVVIQEHL